MKSQQGFLPLLQAENDTKMNPQKMNHIIGTDKFTELLQRNLKEKEGKANTKKKQLQQQRLAMYANIKERVADTIFEAQIFIRAFRAKLKRQELDKQQQKLDREKSFIRPRFNQMVSNKKENFEVKEGFDKIGNDFTQMEKFLDYQSQRNILDRVEIKEMQFLNGSDSINLNQSFNITYQSIQTTSQKYYFPFDSYQPTYKDSDLEQLLFEEDYDNIDFGIPNSKQSVMCFSQKDDLFALALTNGVLRVRDIKLKKMYEINNHLHHQTSDYESRGRDIICLQIVEEQNILICGHESGSLSMYDYKMNKLVFFTKNFFKYNSSIIEQAAANKSSLSVLDMKLIFQDFEDEKIYLVASNARGDCILVKISNGILSYELDIVFLVKHELFPITQITLLNSYLYNKYFLNPNSQPDDIPNEFIVSLTSPEKLYIIQLKLSKMKAKLLFRHLEKQDTLVHNSKCCFVWGETNFYLTQEKQLILFVSFSNYMYTGIVNRSEEEKMTDSGRIKIKQIFTFELKKQIKHYTSILFIIALYHHIFLIYDYNQTFYLINARDLRLSFARYISLSYLQPYKVEMPTLSIRPSSYNLDEFQLKAQRMVKIISQQTNNSEAKLEDLHQANSFLDKENAEEAEIHLSLRNRLFYTNSVSFIVHRSTCYLLTFKEGQNSQFIKISLRSWRDTLEEFLKQGDYLKAMHFLHSIYYGLHKFAFSELPKFELKDLLAPQIERVTFNFLNCVFRQMQEERNQQIALSSDSFRNSYAITNNTLIENINLMEVQDKLLKPFCDVNFLGDHDKIIFVIEFLELCNQSDLIFTDIRNQCFKVVKSIDFFVECLEPFILEGKISQLPNDTLTEIIDYYQQRGNLKIIQQVLTSLDLENLDTKPLIFLSMEKQLITALIYLSTRQKKPDFITPLLVFWNQFVKSLRIWEEKLHGRSRSFMRNVQEDIVRSGSSRTTTVEILQRGIGMKSEEEMFLSEQIMLQRVPDFLKIRTEYEGLRALWYFKLCIKQRLIDGEYIVEDHFEQVIKSFDEWLSFEDNIEVCLQRWPYAFFDVLRAFFQEKSLKILNRDQKKQKMYSQSYQPLAMIRVMNEFCCNKSNPLPSEYLLRLIIKSTLNVESKFDVCYRSSTERKVERVETINEVQDHSFSNGESYILKEEESEDLSTYRHFVEKNLNSNQFNTLLQLRRDALFSSFYLFLAHLFYESQCNDDASYMSGLFSFRLTKIEEIVFYLAANPKALDQLEFSQEQLTKYSAIYNLKDTPCNYLELSQLLRSEVMLKLIKNIYPNLKPANKRDELSLLLDSTEFVTARSHVLLLREQYYRATDSYLQSPNKMISRLIFKWMNNNLQQSQKEDEQKFLIMKEIMKKKLPNLISIDSEQTHLLFQKYLNDAEQDIISKLSNHANLQLLYIQNVIKSYKVAIKIDPTSADKLTVDTQILILHIQLMCNLDKSEEEIFNEITSIDIYPLKEILVICQEKQYMEVCSFIHLRMGNADLAIRSQIKIFENTFKAFRKYLEDFFLKIANESNLRSYFSPDEKNRNQSFQLFGNSQIQDDFNGYEGDMQRSGTNMALSLITQNLRSQSVSQSKADSIGEKVAFFNDQIDQNVKKAWEICTNNKSYDRPGENWFLLLDLLIEVGNKNEDMKHAEALNSMRNKYSQVIGETIMEIGGQIGIEDLLKKISGNQTSANIAELKDTFTKLLSNSIESLNYLLCSHTLVQEDLLSLINTASETFLRGQNSESRCVVCLESLHSIDTIRKKIRKHVISRAFKMRKGSSTKQEIEESENGQPPKENDSFEEINDEDDQEGSSIIVFFCGHSYHKECCFRQKSQNICTECLKYKSNLVFLMVQKRDLDIRQLATFIKLQSELEENKQVSRSGSEILSVSRNTSVDFRFQAETEDKEEIKKFNQVKRLNKLRNFDKYQDAKYSNLGIDSSTILKSM